MVTITSNTASQKLKTVIDTATQEGPKHWYITHWIVIRKNEECKIAANSIKSQIPVTEVTWSTFNLHPKVLDTKLANFVYRNK